MFDRYRSHIPVAVFENAQKINNIVYALPAHTSRKTHPLDVCAFSPFKAALIEALNMAVAQNWEDKWDPY